MQSIKFWNRSLWIADNSDIDEIKQICSDLTRPIGFWFSVKFFFFPVLMLLASIGWAVSMSLSWGELIFSVVLLNITLNFMLSFLGISIWNFFEEFQEINISQYKKIKGMCANESQLSKYVEKILRERGKITLWQYEKILKIDDILLSLQKQSQAYEVKTQTVADLKHTVSNI